MGRLIITSIALVTVVVVAILAMNSANIADSAIKCSQPERIVDGVSFAFDSGDVSLGSLESRIDSALQVELTTPEFDDDLVARSNTLEYRVCQAIAEIDCRDEIDCASEKAQLLSTATERIDQLMIQRKQVAFESAASDCLAEALADSVATGTRSVRGGARAGSPGIGGGRKTGRANVCVSLGPQERYLSARTTNLSCHGGRCSVTAPTFDPSTQQVCVQATAWSESNAFGGGGSGQYELFVEYETLPTDEQRTALEAQCRQRLAERFGSLGPSNRLLSQFEPQG